MNGRLVTAATSTAESARPHAELQHTPSTIGSHSRRTSWIGLIIIVKELPLLFGDLSPTRKSIPLAILNLPSSLVSGSFDISVVGVLSLALMFWLNRSKQRWTKFLPAPLFVVCVGIILGYVLNFQPKFLIAMPDNFMKDSFTLPDFAKVWHEPSLWSSILIVVITLTLIDGIGVAGHGRRGR